MISSCTLDKSEVPPSPSLPPPDTLIVCDSIIVKDTITGYYYEVNVCDTLTACDIANVTYDVDIKPIISANCAIPGCHASGFGAGDFTTYAGLKAKVDAGINGTVNDRVVILKDMPLGGSLTQDEILKIDCWIKDGAPNN